MVDSFSTDETLAIISKFPQARVFQRRFDCPANQYNFGLKETGVQTEWVLALDADYVLSDELIEELRGLQPRDGVSGYRARFTYCVLGKKLRTSLYPPGIVLFRRTKGVFYQDGHTHRLKVDGTIEDFRFPVLHDDRKPLSRWLKYQNQMAELEARKIKQTKFRQLDWPDRVRKARILGPPLVLLYCLFVKGLILDGVAGVLYTLQRVYAELLLSYRLLESDLRGRVERAKSPNDSSWN